MFKFLKRLRDKKKASPDALEEKSVEPVASAPIESPTPEKTRDSITEPSPAETEQAPVSQDPIVEPSTPVETPADPVDLEVEVDREPKPASEPTGLVEEVELPKRSLLDGVRSLFSDDVDLDDLEDILIRADFGLEMSEQITAELQALASKKGSSSDAELRLLLRDILVQALARDDSQLNLSDGKLPYVFLVIGVNGAGKTTTIGKLAKWLTDGEWQVVLGAADTYRAAAVDQLETWSQRSGAAILKPERDGQDPASVAFQAVEHAIRTDADIAIIDTAGRLQNKKDLMDELGKIRRAVEKQAKVNEVLLVIDATTGQNAVSQARAFTEVADVTGVVVTKLDGTAKGGILYSIQKELDIPVKLVGVGEGVNDFAFFSAEEFANGLVARGNSTPPN